MSDAAILWASRQRMACARDWRVLIALAELADGEGVVHPGFERGLLERSRLAWTEFAHAMNALIGAGLVQFWPIDLVWGIKLFTLWDFDLRAKIDMGAAP